MSRILPVHAPHREGPVFPERAGLPIETLHADLLGNAEGVMPDEADEVQIRQMVETISTTLLETGVEPCNLEVILKNQDFLNRNWNTAKTILEEILKEKTE